MQRIIEKLEQLLEWKDSDDKYKYTTREIATWHGVRIQTVNASRNNPIPYKRDIHDMLYVLSQARFEVLPQLIEELKTLSSCESNSGLTGRVTAAQKQPNQVTLTIDLLNVDTLTRSLQ